MTEALAKVSRRAATRLRGAMALMGLGLGTTTAGLGWDFYVHEVVNQVKTVESIIAPPHLIIFWGFAITGLGFLWALAGERPSPPARAT